MRAIQHLTRRLAAVVCFAVACGGGSTDSGSRNTPTGPQPPGSQPPASASQITVRNNRFDPNATTVTAGTTVTWTWDACDDDGYGGRTCVEHNVTFDGGGPSSSTQSTGSFSRQFTAAGTFGYHCTRHVSMSGQVVVR